MNFRTRLSRATPRSKQPATRGAIQRRCLWDLPGAPGVRLWNLPRATTRQRSRERKSSSAFIGGIRRRRRRGGGWGWGEATSEMARHVRALQRNGRAPPLNPANHDRRKPRNQTRLRFNVVLNLLRLERVGPPPIFYVEIRRIQGKRMARKCKDLSRG